MTAFVETLYARKRHVGYGVFVEWCGDDGLKHGRCAGSFLLKDCGGDAAIALHLANTLRDDINQRKD